MLFDDKALDPVIKNLEKIQSELSKISASIEKIFTEVSESFETYSFSDFYERLYEFSESFDKIAKYFETEEKIEKRRKLPFETEKTIESIEKLNNTIIEKLSKPEITFSAGILPISFDGGTINTITENFRAAISKIKPKFSKIPHILVKIYEFLKIFSEEIKFKVLEFSKNLDKIYKFLKISFQEIKIRILEFSKNINKIYDFLKTFLYGLIKKIYVKPFEIKKEISIDGRIKRHLNLITVNLLNISKSVQKSTGILTKIQNITLRTFSTIKDFFIKFLKVSQISTKIYDFFKIFSQEIKLKFSKLLDIISKAKQSQIVKNIISKTKQLQVIKNIISKIKQSQIVRNIISKVKQLQIIRNIKKPLNLIIDKLSNILNFIQKSNNILIKILNITSKVFSAIKNFSVKFWEIISKVFKKLFNVLRRFFGSLINKVKSGFKKLEESGLTTTFLIGVVIGFLFKKFPGLLRAILKIGEILYKTLETFLSIFGLRRAAPAIFWGTVAGLFLKPKLIFSILKFVSKAFWTVIKWTGLTLIQTISNLIRGIPLGQAIARAGIFAKISPIISKILPVLSKFFSILGKTFSTLFGKLSGLVSGLSRFLPILGRIFTIIGRFAPIIGMIVGIITMIIDIFKAIRKPFEGVGRGFSAFGAALAGTGRGFGNAIMNALKWGGILAGIGSIIPGIGTLIGGAIGGIFGFILGLIGGENIARALQTTFQTIGNFFRSIPQFFTGVVQFFENLIRGISLEPIKKFFKNIIDKLKQIPKYIMKFLIFIPLLIPIPGIFISLFALLFKFKESMKKFLGNIIDKLKQTLKYIKKFLIFIPLLVPIPGIFIFLFALLFRFKDRIVSFLKDKFSKFISVIFNTIKKLGSTILNLIAFIPRLILGFVKFENRIINFLKNKFSEFISTIFGAIKKLIFTILNLITLIPKLILGLAFKLGQNIGRFILKLTEKFPGLHKAITKLQEKVLGFVSKTTEKLKGFVSGLGQKITGFLSNFSQSISSKMESIRTPEISLRPQVIRISTNPGIILSDGTILKPEIKVPQTKVISKVNFPEEPFRLLIDLTETKINILAEIRDSLNEIKRMQELIIASSPLTAPIRLLTSLIKH